MALLTVKLADGHKVEFDDQSIASGGEKVVFFTKDKSQVVCFFFGKMADRAERRKRLENIIGPYNPTLTGQAAEYWKRYFCWPTAMIDGDGGLPKSFFLANNIQDSPLGLVAPAYRSNFFFVNTRGKKVEKNGRWFTGEKSRRLLPAEEKGSFYNYLVLCTRMARAIRRMHFAGLAHSDLSNKNVLIDPKGADVCVIDIDSLVVPGVAPPSVYGTPGYIAPEVVAGKALPSISTDLHALAVLIYESLLLRHPLRGPKVHHQVPEDDERLAMGTRALFIEHPTDRSNALKPSPKIPFTALGPYLGSLILRAFVEGLHDPAKRPTAADWEKGLYRTMDLLQPRPDGRGDYFVIDPQKQPLECPFTRLRSRSPVPFARFYRESRPGHFNWEQHGLAIYHHLRFYKWHTTANQTPGENADPQPQGYFSFHEGKWVMVNQSGSPMTILPSRRSIPHNGMVEITQGLQVRFTHPNGRLWLFELLPP